jgi:hypothetical protein
LLRFSAQSCAKPLKRNLLILKKNANLQKAGKLLKTAVFELEILAISDLSKPAFLHSKVVWRKAKGEKGTQGLVANW